MNALPSEFALPLRLVERDLFQALLSQFILERTEDGGAHLTLALDGETATIWRRDAKSRLMHTMPRFKEKAKEYQDRLDAILIHGMADRFAFNDPDFLFRYGNGGTLPLIHLLGREYYALFYRDVFPIGWNIANGASDSYQELIDPLETVERELREELILVNFERRTRYILSWEGGTPLDRPEFVAALKHWRTLAGHDHDLLSFDQESVPIKWLGGADSITVQVGDKRSQHDGLFLNINALDFGIEIDNVAQIRLDVGIALLDGEIRNGELLDRPIGLFEAQKTREALVEDPPKREFWPDLIFHGGRERQISDFLSHLSDYRNRALRLGLHSTEISEQWERAEYKFDLCPVTRRIITRSAVGRSPRSTASRKVYDVFVSFASEDIELARRVCRFLSESCHKQVFFCEHDMSPIWARRIEVALDESRCLVAVATKSEHLMKPWVSYEWLSRHVEILNGTLPEDSLVSFISAFPWQELPRPLLYRKWFVYEPQTEQLCLAQLGEYVDFVCSTAKQYRSRAELDLS